MDAVPAGGTAGPQGEGLGQSAGVDGARGGDARRYPPLQRGVFARRCRAGRRRRQSRSRRWIDDWEIKGFERTDDRDPGAADAEGFSADFSYALTLEADRPVVLQGDGGFSRKSERGQASYYYSQPFFRARGSPPPSTTSRSRSSGQAWMDQEWSSQPLDSRPDRMGLAVAAARLRRQVDAVPAAARRTKGLPVRQLDQRRGRHAKMIAGNEIQMMPKATARRVAGRKPPVQWQIAIPSQGILDPLHAAQSQKPRWGPASPIGRDRSAFAGTHDGVGHPELTERYSTATSLATGPAMYHLTALVTLLGRSCFTSSPVELTSRRRAPGRASRCRRCRDTRISSAPSAFR